jgi:hypothetical protein
MRYTWHAALAILRQGHPENPASFASQREFEQAMREYEWALGLVFDEVRERIGTSDDGLRDFLITWHYRGCESAECIADEWDMQKVASECI